MSRNNKDVRRKNVLTDVRNNKSLGNLSRLIRESEVFNRRGSEDDDDVIEAVWRLLSDKRERSVFEIREALKGGVLAAEVETAINVLRNEGKLSARRPNNSGWLYTIKPGISSPAITDLGPVKKPRTLEQTMPSRSSNHTILAEEGLDMCIWKLMSDLRFRKADEIGNLLHEYGISAVDARARVAILVRRGWFSRSGTNTRTEYGLKKGIPMPIVDKPVVVEDEPKVNSTTTLRERSTITMPKPIIPMVSASSPQPPAEVKVEPIAPAAPVTPALAQGDSTEVAIWKVMSDHQGWLPSEVALLLADFGFRSKTVGIRIGTLFSTKQWFTRVEEGRSFRYTLLPHIEMPAQEAKDADAPAPVESTTTQPQLFPQSAVSAVSEEKASDMTSNYPGTQNGNAAAVVVPPAVIAAPVAVVKEVPKRSYKDSTMLSFHASIKGTKFTIEQVKILTQELVANGYGQGKVSMEPPKFLVTQHKIRDQLFTDAELEMLTLELIDAGFNEPDEE